MDPTGSIKYAKESRIIVWPKCPTIILGTVDERSVSTNIQWWGFVAALLET